ncbi:UDP-2,3-diacylglucosamine diphosphatase [Sphingobacterium sp. CZ-2]|uniref:UDP-2,3-diacylglucosamine diphosphatase n=1 Tax=Sphingobacterium sp. CZ-2 TaxID=2557994 RepID=UPI0010704097|nr:UDP-2,3-diacylglucosamine diphosphatase [Sphingobacterium sp. CZ-2]QBR10924.1 UDP-2,3-diacylglucosamine diphosphatase [Sphingobacterium sp. CZ-2]
MGIRNKIYFASDFHLGSYPTSHSLDRERRIVAWLDHIKTDAKELYLVGDIFDFWFEYASVVPKGYIRFLGKLAELADLGVKITLFKGNHDMWMFGYLKQELGAEVVSNEKVLQVDGKRFYIHHGDGLGPGDAKYKFLKKIFRSRFCQWLFARLHPNLGIGIATRWSKHSRIANNNEEKFLGEENEWLIVYSKEILQGEHYDYFIFGHRHLPYERTIGNQSTIVNLGEWINYNTYAVWDGVQLTLETWSSGK